MITIEVYRGAGDRPGDEIRDPLIGDSRAAAIARGRAELDATASQTVVTTLELIRPRFDLRLGDLISVADPTQGESWKGKITGIEHSSAIPPTTLTVERHV